MEAGTKEKIIIDFLNGSGICCEKFEDLQGLQLQREILLDKGNYEKVRVSIPELKKLFSSSYLTSLQAPAHDRQRWPLINLVRQILKSCHYRLTPRRLCDGYTKDGVKRYKRIFVIEKYVSESVKDLASELLNELPNELPNEILDNQS